MVIACDIDFHQEYSSTDIISGCFLLVSNKGKHLFYAEGVSAKNPAYNDVKSGENANKNDAYRVASRPAG